MSAAGIPNRLLDNCLTRSAVASSKAVPSFRERKLKGRIASPRGCILA